jgi:hypothetical protein
VINAGLKKGTAPRTNNKNILDEMNINKAREIQIVSNPFSYLFNDNDCKCGRGACNTGLSDI